jgi:hypothetical protein
VLLTMGVYYVTITRKANINRANSDQPNAWCGHPLIKSKWLLPTLSLSLSLCDFGHRVYIYCVISDYCVVFYNYNQSSSC